MVQARFAMFLAVVLTATAVVAQNTYQLFGPVNTRPSSYTTPTAFGTATLNLQCPASPTAILSSSPTATNSTYANVFSDNYIGLTVNGGTRKNVCTNGYTDAPEGGTDCFNQAYTSAYSGLLGQDPDNFVATYGVPALDISADLAGTTQAKFELLDFGTSLGSSSVYLITNCAQSSIAPGGSITGNPIPTASPTPAQLTQTFPFDGQNGQRVEFIADYSAASAANTLTIVDGTIPVVNNQGLSPSSWPAIVNGTSFATTTCVPDLGEVDSSGNPLCKLSTILCTNNLSSTPAGDNCPQSSAKNVRMFHTFDAPSASVMNLPAGTGLGFLMGSDNWPQNSCVFVGPEAGVMCPQNPITAFLGDFSSGTGGRTTNSTFIVVAGVPLPSTAASFTPNNSGWSNSQNVALNFVSSPPPVPSPNTNNFVPAAVQTLTYGIDSPAPYPDTSLPIPGDVTLPKSGAAPCPLMPTPPLVPQLQTSDAVTLSEGSHVLHYFSTDCAGTEELVFTPSASNPNNWATFKTLAINVDTTQPTVASGPTLSPASSSYTLNQAVTASYSCTDSTSTPGATPSGVTVCGPPSAKPLAAPTLNTGTLTSTVNTSTVGPQTFTVSVKDLAGNVGAPVSVNYNIGYNFKGFLFPVSNPPTLNYVLAGIYVPLRFTLGGNQGLGILAAGSPVSVPIACPGKPAPPATPNLESPSGLVYDPLTGVYIYIWKTNKTWVHTCRQITIQLKDGTTHSANFDFADD